MNVENMLALSYFLDRIDSESFDLSNWASLGENRLSIGEFIASVEGEDKQCGTSACIAGWAVYLFSLDAKNQSELPFITTLDDINQVDSSYNFYNKTNLVSYKYDAFAEHWLGLTNEQAVTLFYCDEGSLWDIHSDDYDITRDRANCGYNSGIENEYPVYMKSIHPKHAADLLRRLALGEISFPERW